MTLELDPISVQSIRRALLQWYRRNARDLPWRRTSDPYAIWVSEVMLQQTQVETVIPYYNRFMKALPTIQHLAKAKPDHLMKLWEGLGYYRRAVNLQRAAQIVLREFNGSVPSSVDELQSLPGVGRYTAGAIASIAYNLPAPILDGNVKRVLSRLIPIQEPIDQSSVVTSLWRYAEILVAPRSPGNFNQAMMELGARICLPTNPKCGSCPLKRTCQAHHLGIATKLPIKSPKRIVPHAHVVAAAIKKNGRYLLGRRPIGGMLGGLWEFPGGKVEPGESYEEALIREIQEELDIPIEIMDHVASVKHTYSHLKVTLHLYLCIQKGGTPKKLYHSDLLWVLPSKFKRYAFPKANEHFLELL